MKEWTEGREEGVFRWDDIGEPGLDGIVEHQSLEMIMNETKTTFQTGDAVFMQTPEGCEETYVARIEKMWQEGEDPEKRGKSCMRMRCQWYYPVRIGANLHMSDVVPFHCNGTAHVLVTTERMCFQKAYQ